MHAKHASNNQLTIQTGRQVQARDRIAQRIPLQATHHLLQNQDLASECLKRRQRLHVSGHPPQRPMEAAEQDRRRPQVDQDDSLRAPAGRCGRS